MNKLNFKTGDTVIVLSGRDKGKQGKILSAQPDKGTVIVEGVSVATVHTKPRRQGESGGIIEKSTPIRACKVMRVCPKCGKPTRPAHKLDGGKKTIVCKKCGAEI